METKSNFKSFPSVPLYELVKHQIPRQNSEIVSKPSHKASNELSSLRVIQGNLVYVTNIPASLSSAEKITQYEFFGQYGKIEKCIVRRSKGSSELSFNAYITFSTSEEATLCIKACNFFQIDNKVLEVSLGTTRYCSHFLNGLKCSRTECLFLHERRPDCEVFLNDILSVKKQSLAISNSTLDNTNYEFRTSQETVLPKARKLTDQEIIHKQLSSEPESPYTGLKRKQSRFLFARGGDELVYDQNEVMLDLVNGNSPSKNNAHLTFDQFEEIVSSGNGNSWATDLFHAIPLRQSFDVVKYGELDDVYLLSRNYT